MPRKLKKVLATKKEEKLEFERKLEMGNERNDTGIEELNCSGPSSGVPKTRAEKGIGLQLCKNPLKYPHIIKNVFQYLDTKDAKNLRLVSKEWSSAGLGVLFTRSRITFRCPEDMPNFLKRFSKTSYEMIAFRKYTFLSEDDELWPVDELEEFFNKQGKYITELKFKQIELMDNCNEKLMTWDISSWISKCAMAKQTKRNGNSKLSVTICEDKDDITYMSIDLRSLECVKELTLRNVTVNIQDGIRICPTKLKLTDLMFTEDGRSLTGEFDLERIVDLGKVPYYDINSYIYSGDYKVSVEMKGDCLGRKSGIPCTHDEHI